VPVAAVAAGVRVPVAAVAAGVRVPVAAVAAGVRVPAAAVAAGVRVPAAAGRRVHLVWENQAGRLTFEVGTGCGRRLVKWAPAAQH